MAHFSTAILTCLVAFCLVRSASAQSIDATVSFLSAKLPALFSINYDTVLLGIDSNGMSAPPDVWVERYKDEPAHARVQSYILWKNITAISITNTEDDKITISLAGKFKQGSRQSIDDTFKLVDVNSVTICCKNERADVDRVVKAIKHLCALKGTTIADDELFQEPEQSVRQKPDNSNNDSSTAQVKQPYPDQTVPKWIANKGGVGSIEIQDMRVIPDPVAPSPAKGAKSRGTFTVHDLKQQVPQSKDGNWLLAVPEIYFAGNDLEVRRVLNGLVVETIAQVLPEKPDNINGQRMRVFDMLVECCNAHARPFALSVCGETASGFVALRWVKVVGKLRYEEVGAESVPVIEAITVEQTSAPVNATISMCPKLGQDPQR